MISLPFTYTAHFLICTYHVITRYLVRRCKYTLYGTVHYSALPYIASYFHDFSVCIFTVMLPPLFPMTFFFSYGVNWYYACSNFTSRFKLFSCQRAMITFRGIPSLPFSFWILSSRSFTGIHCITLYSHCQEIFFLPAPSFVLPFRRESVAGRVRNVRCSGVFRHAIRT